MIQIVFPEKWQCEIADMLWAAESYDEVQSIIETIGIEAQVVYEMIIAATLDNEDLDLTLAQEIIQNVK
jgi:hypothetical protein